MINEITAREVGARTPRKRVLLVDDNAVVRAGLATLINGERDLLACGDVEDERNACQAVKQLHPDVAVVDWSLRDTDASELVSKLHRDHPLMPVLVLSVHDEIFYAERAMRAGALGYVMKREAADTIVAAIRCVAEGRAYLSERARRAIPDDRRQQIEESWKGGSGGQGPARGVSGEAPLPSRNPPGNQLENAVISIVIPVYNSETTIESLCKMLVSKLALSHPLQIVLVDDGSTDNSAMVCQQVHERYPDLVDFVALSKNFGEHNAVMAGLHWAEGDYCIIMDDDFQNPPSEVHKLIAEIAKGYDVVYTRYEAKHHSAFRNLGSRLHNWMATQALGKPPELYLSSFKVMSRFLAKEVVRYTGPDPYVDALIFRMTRRVGFVTVKHEASRRAKSGYTLRKLISLWSNMFVASSLYPLQIMGGLAVFMSLAGCLMGLYLMVSVFVPWPTPGAGPGHKDVSTWFWRGAHLLVLSIVAQYVGKIYRHISHVPQFVVRKVFRRQPRN